MHTLFARFAIALPLVFAASLATAQEAPKPSAEHAKLAAFVGSWSYRITGSPTGGGTWTVAPVAGGFFYRATEAFRAESGATTDIVGIFGYDPATQAFTWYRYWSNGHSDFAHGWLRDNTWYWVFEDRVQEGRQVRWQVSVTLARPDSMTFTWQRSVDGGPWETTGEGRATKSR